MLINSPSLKGIAFQAYPFSMISIMPAVDLGPRLSLQIPITHTRIIGALMMRETMTRYGREGLGFAWLIAEPLIFCVGVIIMWSLMKPEYEHGIQVGTFVMSGYMCLILLRHVVSFSIGAIQANIGLLYHRRVTIVHIFASRNLLELGGSTIAFIVIYLIMNALGFAPAPSDLLLMGYGWILLFLLSVALGMILSALSTQFAILERVVPLIQYLLIPLSGVFMMLAWLPAQFREIMLYIPLPHAVEMVRAGMFGEFVPTYYSLTYPLAWALGLNLVGLLMLVHSKQYIDVE